MDRNRHDVPAGVIEPPYPRRFLRDVFERNRIPLGAHILDAGCGRGALVRYLASLGFDATGLDESEANVDFARANAPDLEFFIGGAPREQFGSPSTTFDVVLARGLSIWTRSIFSRTAFLTTASLLSCLRPGGTLLFVCEGTPAAAPHLFQHDALCFAKHLAQFPGTCCIDRFPASLLASKHALEFTTVGLKLDRVTRSGAEWDQLGLKASAALDGACCVASHALRRAA